MMVDILEHRDKNGVYEGSVLKDRSVQAELTARLMVASLLQGREIKSSLGHLLYLGNLSPEIRSQLASIKTTCIFEYSFAKCHKTGRI